MADLGKTVKLIDRQESSSNRLFDAANALIRKVNNAGSNVSALDQVSGQINNLDNKIQQQLLVLQTLKSDLSGAGPLTDMDSRMALETADSFIDLLSERSRELRKLPATIAQARAVIRQDSPANKISRQKAQSERVSTGPPVTSSFDPAIAAAAQASPLTDLEMEQERLLGGYIARASSAPLPPPPIPPGPKFSTISREEAMSGGRPSGGSPPRPPRPPKPPRPPRDTPPPPPQGNNDEGDGGSDEAGPYGPYPAGFDPNREASRLRGTLSQINPRLGVVAARGRYESDEERENLSRDISVLRQQAQVFSATYDSPVARSIEAAANRAGKRAHGLPGVLGQATAFNRFAETVDPQFRELVQGRTASPGEMRSFEELIRGHEESISLDESLDPSTRNQLLSRLNTYSRQARRLVDVQGIAPGAFGSALGGVGDENGNFNGLSPTAARIGREASDRLPEIMRSQAAPNTLSGNRRQSLIEELEVERRLLQIEQQRLQNLQNMERNQGTLTRVKRQEYEQAQGELRVLQEENSQHRQMVGNVQARHTFGSAFTDTLRHGAPDLGEAITAWATNPATATNQNTIFGRIAGGLRTGLVNNGQTIGNLLTNPAEAAIRGIQGVGRGVGTAIGGAIGGGELAGLGGAAGSFAAIPVAGAIAGVLGIMLGQIGRATEHGTAIENLYRRGGVAGTGQQSVGRNFTDFYYGDILGAGNDAGYSRDQTVQTAQTLASAGMDQTNVLNGSRLKNFFGFTRMMGADVGVTGQALTSMQRLDIGRGDDQSRVLNLLAQSISQGRMHGRENEVIDSISRLTTSLAERGAGVGADQRTAGLATILNTSPNANLRGAFGASVLGNLDQGIQGAGDYMQAFMFNSYQRQAQAKGETMDPFEFQYQQAAGVGSPYALGMMREIVQTGGGPQRAGISIGRQFGLNPLVGRQLAQMIQGGQLTEENLQETITKLNTRTVETAVGGRVGTTATELGTFEHLSQSMNTLTNEFENWASQIAGPIDVITNGLAKLSGAITYVMGFGNGPVSTGNDPLLDAMNGLTGQNFFRPPGFTPQRTAAPNNTSPNITPGTSASSVNRASSPIQRMQQAYGNTCSAATLASIYQAQTGKVVTEEEVAQTLGITPDRSGNLPGLTWANVGPAMERLNQTYGTNLMAQNVTPDDAIASLQKGIPLMFSVNPNYTTEEASGLSRDHIMGASGIDSEGMVQLFDSSRRNLSRVSQDAFRNIAGWGGGGIWAMNNFSSVQGRGNPDTSGTYTGSLYADRLRAQENTPGLLDEMSAAGGSDISVNLLRAVQANEGGSTTGPWGMGDPDINGGSWGMMQINDTWLRSWASRNGVTIQQARSDRATNLRAAADHLREKRDNLRQQLGREPSEGEVAAAYNGSGSAATAYGQRATIMISGMSGEPAGQPSQISIPSIVDQQMEGPEASAAKQMFALNVRFAPATVELTMNGEPVGSATINAFEDGIAYVDQSPQASMTGYD